MNQMLDYESDIVQISMFVGFDYKFSEPLDHETKMYLKVGQML